MYRLPAGGSRARVAVWREIRRSGALHVQQSVVAFPDVPEFEEDVRRLRTLIDDYGGTSLAMRADPMLKDEEHELISAWNAGVDAEYKELLAQYEKFRAEVERTLSDETHTRGLTHAEAELARLESWHDRILERDIYGAADRQAGSRTERSRAKAALAQLASALNEGDGR